MPNMHGQSKYDWLLARPIAHRGLHNKAIGVYENTASAFAAALRQNYAIECDLQISSDGQAMVFHDETLDRLTSEKGLLRNRSAHDLQKIEIGSGTDRMQRLPELLEQVASSVTLVIELKSHWDGDVSLAKKALQDLASYPGPFALMSFDPDLVAAVAELSPQTIRGLTADRAEDKYYDALPAHRRLELRTLSHLPRTRPHFVSYYFRDLPNPPIQALREAGCPLITWTIRNENDMHQALLHSDQVTFEGFAA